MKYFPDAFSKNIQISNLMKILSVGAELLHVGGDLDMTELSVAFRNFANASKCEVFKCTLLYDTSPPPSVTFKRGSRAGRSGVRISVR